MKSDCCGAEMNEGLFIYSDNVIHYCPSCGLGCKVFLETLKEMIEKRKSKDVPVFRKS